MRIKELEIVSFRGIPNNLHIDFPIKNNKPTSWIIVGDNGVGKSSIIDAVEFCLQGHIAQNKKLTNPHSPSLLSLKSTRKPNITIKLDNDEIMNRKILNDEQGLLSNIKNPHSAFSISPFVIRRHDILRFINTSEAERTLVFSNYLRNEINGEWAEHPEDELNRRLSERLIAKKERDSLIKKLALSLKIDASKIPFERKEFYEFVKEKIYNGLPKTQFESLGYRVKLNTKAEKLAEKVYEAIENHRKIKSAVGSFSISSQTSFPKHLYSQLENFLIKASEKLTNSFLEISPLKFIERIEIVYENDSVIALTVNIILTNGKQCNPNQVLSEANLDLLALLFFMAFIEESAERGQSKFLILDDVLQSIDATIRVSFMSYLLKKFKDWQFIITVHDRLWHRQLTELFILNG
jgi:recombinational DNA repair ATPase RecF